VAIRALTTYPARILVLQPQEFRVVCGNIDG
jgi:hypothetical protein